MDHLRPNTTAPDAILHDTLVLCSGEDKAQLVQALARCTPARPREQHEFRCYHFWRYPEFTLAWTGIGTGCLEPFLGEVLPCDRVRRIYLIGTCGIMNEARCQRGTPYLMDPAAFAATAFDAHPPVNYQFSTATLPAEKRSIVSTDLYYAFSAATVERRENPALSRYKTQFLQARDQYDLIDMETAMFYLLCNAYGHHHLQYLAIKSPANIASHFHDQVQHSTHALTATLHTVLQTL